MVGINFMRDEQSRLQKARRRRAQMQRIAGGLVIGVVITDGLLRWDEARCVHEYERLSESREHSQKVHKALSIDAAQDEVSEREERELQSIRHDSINPVEILKELVDSLPQGAALSELFVDSSAIRIKAMSITKGESTRIVQIVEALFPTARVQVSATSHHSGGRGEECVITVDGWIPLLQGAGS